MGYSSRGRKESDRTEQLSIAQIKSHPTFIMRKHDIVEWQYFQTDLQTQYNPSKIPFGFFIEIDEGHSIKKKKKKSKVEELKFLYLETFAKLPHSRGYGATIKINLWIRGLEFILRKYTLHLW